MENLWELSEKALQIVKYRPKAWEYRLFAQVIIDEVEANKKLIQQEQISHASVINEIPILETALWVSERVNELVDIVPQIESLMNSSHENAFGPPGEPGDVSAIVSFSREIGFFHRRTIEWAQIIQNTPVDGRCNRLIDELVSFSKVVTEPIERYGNDLLRRIDEGLSAPPGSSKRNIEAKIVLKGWNTDTFVEQLNLITAAVGDLSNRISSYPKSSRDSHARAEEREEKKQLARDRTEDAKATIQSLERILLASLQLDHKIDWESLKDRSTFPTPEPVRPTPPDLPPEPSADMSHYRPRFSIFDHLVPCLKRKRIQQMGQKYQADHNAWMKVKAEIEATLKEADKDHKNEVEQWTQKRHEFEETRRRRNEKIDQDREKYFATHKDSIVHYCNLVLNRSNYPDFFPRYFDIDYNDSTKAVVVDHLLPSPKDIPTLKEVNYVQSKNGYIEKHLAASERDKLYDSLIYQVALRTLHELFQADSAGAINSVTFNGRVNFTEKATGKRSSACILSVQADRQEFEGINLSEVDPKSCFKALKGVGSSKLHSLTPVTPIVRIEREDARFVDGYGVAEQLDDTVNLAAMDWQDFEHLVRELFEREFSVSGGEVKITRASRDGGVDAVAFDPDPIRGGKIVIQAKRYASTVGVAAVRDLYGTVINEGATKGILVTTSDYGPDAYEFAKGKPLTLLNGSNLLHLLAKHGHRAKIDLKEAKEILADKQE